MQGDAADLLLAYDDDFVGFTESASAATPALGGTADPDGYYDDFAANVDMTQLQQTFGGGETVRLVEYSDGDSDSDVGVDDVIEDRDENVTPGGDEHLSETYMDESALEGPTSVPFQAELVDDSDMGVTSILDAVVPSC